MVAVDDEEAAPVGGFMDRGFGDVDAAEMRAVIATQEFVVIAGNVDDAGALARFAQQFLYYVVMLLRPVPVGLQLPSIDDVAHQIDYVCVVIAEEIEEAFGLASPGAEMHVGDKKCTKSTGACYCRHDIPDASTLIMRSLCQLSMSG